VPTSPVATVTLVGFVIADPPTMTGLVTAHEKFILQLLCPAKMEQFGVVGVSVPDMGFVSVQEAFVPPPEPLQDQVQAVAPLTLRALVPELQL
jgi:hypothetical protein